MREEEAIAAHNRRVVSPLERIGELDVAIRLKSVAAVKDGKLEDDETHAVMRALMKEREDAIDAYLKEQK